MEYPHPLCAREGRQRMSPLRKALSEVNSQKKEPPRLEGSFGTSKATLLTRKDKGKEQEDGNPVDFLQNTYGKCHTDDRQDQEQNG